MYDDTDGDAPPSSLGSLVGGLDTLEWEAFREGIDDVAYVERASALVDSEKVQACKDWAEDCLNAALSPYKPVQPSPERAFRNSDLTATRSSIQELILWLQRDCDGCNTSGSCHQELP